MDIDMPLKHGKIHDLSTINLNNMMKRSLMLCAAVGVLLSCQQVSERKALSQQEPLQGAMFGSFMEVSPTQQEKPKYILMEVVPDLMKFSLDTFTVQARSEERRVGIEDRV